jgi:hypothetical protein
VASPMGKEADPRQCWVLAEVVRGPEMTDMPRRPYTVKGKCSQGFRQGQHWKRKPESKDIREETMNALRVQQWNRGTRRKRGDSTSDEEDI